MPKVHYFQRYSSVENTVTNNTLQLLARINDYSPSAASRFLTNLTGAPIDIGIEIAQQHRGSVSVPDGAILQRSFKILVEAKVDSAVDMSQLLRHAASFGGEAQKVLLLLTKQHVARLELKDIEERIHGDHADVIFRNVTFGDVCNATKGLFKDHEETMVALVEDYVEYCNDAQLVDQSKYLLRIVPCGQSISINIKYGIYFQPSDRGYTRHALIGIYSDKSVRAILAVKSIFDITLVDGRLSKELIEGDQTDEFDTRLRDIIDAARTDCGYEVATGHRFFCGEVFETDFQKTSFGGIQGARFINVRELLGSAPQPAEIANRLRGIQWT